MLWRQVPNNMMKMNISRFWLAAGFLIASLAVIPPQAMRAGAQTQSNNVPAPETKLGFKIGEDRKLAKWDQFLAYISDLTKTNESIKFDTLDKTTQVRPVSAAAM